MAATHHLSDDPATERAVISAISHEYPPDRLPKQLGLFFLVGTLGTIVEFAVLNFFLYVLHLPLVVANSFGISAGLIVGYFTDKRWVFRNAHPPTRRHFGYFVLITVGGLYGVQNGLLYLFALYPEAPNSLTGVVHSLFTSLPVGAVRANVAKLFAGTLAAAINFVLYRRFVFRYGRAASQA